MPLPLLRKLRHFTRLSADDEKDIEILTTRRRRTVQPHEDVLTEGRRVDAITVIEAGWLARCKVLEDGRRQIVSILLPGDICDLDLLVLNELDHSVTAVTPVIVGEIARGVAEDIFARPSRVREALQWQHYVQTAIQREWTVNLGQRTAYERMAHLLCELHRRLDVVGLVHDGQCEFPLTQIELGEALGLSSVHVNRTLQELRAQGLIVLKDRTLVVPNFGALADTAQFDDGYLHLDHEGKRLDAPA